MNTMENKLNVGLYICFSLGTIRFFLFEMRSVVKKDLTLFSMTLQNDCEKSMTLPDNVAY